MACADREDEFGRQRHRLDGAFEGEENARLIKGNDAAVAFETENCWTKERIKADRVEPA